MILKTTLFVFCLAAGCNTASQMPDKKDTNMQNASSTQAAAVNVPDSLELATLGAGCFWCVEAIYQDLKGVIKVESGYSGGHVTNPTYKEVCAGVTGHTEVIQVTFAPRVIAYREILEIFFQVHDPTTLNRQGNDVGTQYRSAIYYHSPAQKETAGTVKKEAAAWWDDPIVTEIAAFEQFYKAEDYHQNYYKDNPYQPYCSYVIAPKIKKFKEKYQDKLKQ